MTISAASQPLVERLVDDIQGGVDPEAAFHEIFRLYYRPIWGFFVRRGFSSDASKDLTQETFIRVHKGIGDFRGQIGFQHWLFQIAANVWRNELRHRSASKRSGLTVDHDQVADSALAGSMVEARSQRSQLDEYIDNERLTIVRQAVEDLPLQMRRCLLLRATAEMSYVEIANTLHIAVPTVKTHLAEGRKRLRSRLGNGSSELVIFD